MNETNALAVSVGILAGISVIVTDALDIPTWLVFLAWLTYFFCGLGRRGLQLQLASNLWGIAVGVIALAVITAAANLWVTALVVAAAAFTIAQSARVDLLSQSPGSFVGFAMIAAALQVSGETLGSRGYGSPIVLALLATLIGSAFAVTSEHLARVMTASHRVAATPSLPAAP